MKEQYEDLSKKKSEMEHHKQVNDYLTETRNPMNIESSTRGCMLNGCVIGENKFMLNCSKCKQLTHYCCMTFPAS